MPSTCCAVVKLFEKPAFRWREPKAFLKARDAMNEARARWWHKPAQVCVIMLMLLGTWAVARLNPSKQPPSAEYIVPTAFVSGLFLAYGLPWLQGVIHAPSEVRLFSSRILRQHWSNALWDYSKMRCFDWVSGTEYHVLMFQYGPKEHVVCLGVPTDMDTEALSALLLSKGVPRAAVAG